MQLRAGLVTVELTFKQYCEASLTCITVARRTVHYWTVRSHWLQAKTKC